MLEFCSILELVDRIETEEQARVALRAFVFIRRNRKRSYEALGTSTSLDARLLLAAIEEFVHGDSEGGKRAQAVAAGLLDTMVGADRVLSGRINDPSRHHPGDVAVLAASDATIAERVFEIRDKPVAVSDVLLFGRKCMERGVRKAAVVGVAENQEVLPEREIATWAEQHGATLVFLQGWPALLTHVLFWNDRTASDAVTDAVQCIYTRLVSMEVSEAGVTLWVRATKIAP